MALLRHCLMQLRNRNIARLLDGLDLAAIALSESINGDICEPQPFRPGRSNAELVPARNQPDFDRPPTIHN